MVRIIQAAVPRYNIQVPILIDIDQRQASPETGKTPQPAAVGDFMQCAAVVLKNADAHPVPGKDEVGLLIVIDVHPYCGVDQSGVHQRGAYGLRAIGEAAMVVAQDEASRRRRVSAKGHSSADKNIHVTIAIIIRCGHSLARRQDIRRKGKEVLFEIPLAVVDIQAWTQVGRLQLEFAAATDNQQVVDLIAVRIEYNALHVLIILRSGDQVPPVEAAIGLLQEDPAGLMEGPAYEKIFEPIPIHVSHADEGSFLRIFLGDEALKGIVVKKSFFMAKVQFGLWGDVGKECRGGVWAGREVGAGGTGSVECGSDGPGRILRIQVIDGQDRIRWRLPDELHFFIGPYDL